MSLNKESHYLLAIPISGLADQAPSDLVLIEHVGHVKTADAGAGTCDMTRNSGFVGAACCVYDLERQAVLNRATRLS